MDLTCYLSDLHWSEEDQAYCDVTVNDDGKDCDFLPIVSGVLICFGFTQTSPNLFATRDTFRSSRCCCSTSILRRRISEPSSTSSRRLISCGRITVSGPSVYHIRYSAREKITGEVQSGSR